MSQPPSRKVSSTHDLWTRPTMVFDVESNVVDDLRPIERQAHDQVGLAR